MLTIPPVVRPYSAANELWITWYSATASCEKVERTDPTAGSLLSSPSTRMLFDLGLWPLIDSPDVEAAPVCGPRSAVTPGVVNAKSRKLRWLIGRWRIFASSIVLESWVEAGSIRPLWAAIVMDSWTRSISNPIVSGVEAPRTTRTPSTVAVRKPFLDTDRR
jgi:hypothetical protein